MITTYAFGRNPLPAPTISLDKGVGDLDVDQDYYFWIQARNRVGYNTISPVKKVEVRTLYPRDRSIVIEAVNFQQFAWEDWKRFYIYFSTENNLAEARVLYKRENFSPNGSLLPIAPFSITSTDWLTIPRTINSPENLPTVVVPEGFRIAINSLGGQIYEFTTQSLTPNNITILEGEGGFWRLLLGANMVETVDNTDLLVETVPQNLIEPVEITSLFDSKTIKYYLINTSTSSISGQILLNPSINTSTNVAFNIKTIGYVNLSNFSFTTTGITGAGNFSPYNNESARLKIPLPPNHALVLEVEINLSATMNLVQGTLISLTPKIRFLSLLEPPKYWDSPVDNLTFLANLLPEQVIKGQIRYVVSKRDYYYYDPNDSREADGDFIVTPVGLTGRWSRGRFFIPDNSITFQNLNQDLKNRFKGETKILNIEANILGEYILDITNIEENYIIITTPVDNNLIPWIFDIIHTGLQEWESREVVVEFIYRSAPVQFSPLIVFPDNKTPLLSGNASKDIFVFQVQRQSGDNIIKRGFTYAQTV
ncbi:MAG: hypothetical protein CV045_10055 [Cyanobacteria bacterium M5B4]|nr:MAG: hypothetical protein CV045_10055 [Cyanobacteria bacterium M5B4]